MDLISAIDERADKKKPREKEAVILSVGLTTAVVQPVGSARLVTCERDSDQQIGVGQHCTYLWVPGRNKYVLSAIFNRKNTLTPTSNGDSVPDLTAIHINVFNEYRRAENKPFPVGADRVLVEDSENNYRKKFVLLSTLLGGGESGDASGITYDPADSGDWIIPPGYVDDALDELADREDRALHSNVNDEIHSLTETAPTGPDAFLFERSSGSVYDKRWVKYSDMHTTDLVAIHYQTANEINAHVTEKTTPAADDIWLIEDSASAFAKRYVRMSNIRAIDDTAIHDNVSAEISAITQKNVPIAGDLILIEDSESGYVKKYIEVGDLTVSGSSGNGVHTLILTADNDAIFAMSTPRAIHLDGALPDGSLVPDFDLSDETKIVCTADSEGSYLVFVTMGFGFSFYDDATPKVYLKLNGTSISENHFFMQTQALGVGEQHVFVLPVVMVDLVEGDELEVFGDADNASFGMTLLETAASGGPSTITLVRTTTGGSSGEALSGDAYDLPYGPLDPGDWDEEPDNTGEALDELADMLGVVSSAGTDAFHKTVSAEISGLTEKTVLVDDDVFVIEDSEDSSSKKFVKTSNLPTSIGGTDSDAIHDNVSAEISAITEKTTPVSDDWLLIEDSEASNAKKKVKAGNLPASSGSSFDKDLVISIVAESSAVRKDGSDFVSRVWDEGVSPGHFIQDDTGKQPLWVDNIINSRDVIRFNGTDDYLTHTLNSEDYPIGTIAIVIRPLDTESTAGIFSWQSTENSGSPFILVQRNGTDVRIYREGYDYINAHASDTTHIYIITYTKTAYQVWFDGADQGSTPVITENTGTHIWLGNGYNEYANVDIPEFRIYGHDFDSDEIATLEAFLETRYGL